MQYYSLQPRTLLLSLVTSITGHCFHFGSVSSFFLELFLHFSPVAYWAPTDLGSSSFSAGTMQDRNGMDLTEIEVLRRGGKNTEVVCHSY